MGFVNRLEVPVAQLNGTRALIEQRLGVRTEIPHHHLDMDGMVAIHWLTEQAPRPDELDFLRPWTLPPR